MKKIKYVITLAAMIMGATASAALSVSESFATGGGTNYISGTTLSGVGNSNVMAGTVGFRYDTTTTYNWVNGSTALTPNSGKSLTHSLVQGSTSNGALKLTTVNVSSAARISRRQLDINPSGTNFFMSGLVNLNGSLANFSAGEAAAMGLGKNTANNIFDISVGIHLGVAADSNGDVFLAAFAGGNKYLLGDKLTAQQASETQMIVLNIIYGTGVGGMDTLTAWTAQQGATTLTQVLSVSDLNTGTSADIFRFLVGNSNGADTTASTVYLDEFRFGTILQDVTSIPEPATIGMLSLGSLLVMLLRRIRS